MQPEAVQELSSSFRHHLIDDVMSFWEPRTQDKEYGGYLTCFDRTGALTDATKYVWFQGRQFYMFPALYNQVEPREAWLELARWGREFIVAHAYAGDGRWLYQLDRQGKPQKGTISIYSDMFVLQGLCEYAVASGSDQDAELIRATYDGIERNVRDADFKDVYHGTWSPRFLRHGIHMIGLNTAQVAEQVLGPERTRPLIDFCLERVLYMFARDNHEALFESVGRDGEVVDDDEGRALDPGHALESMWFCLEEGRRRGDRSIIDRAVQVAGWTYRRAYDREHGGIVSFLDANGAEPTQKDWHKAINMQWHDKCWWAHSEALYTLALCAAETGSGKWWNRFLDLNTWCRAHFHDPEYGEWYPELYRDGSPKLTDKGTLWKAAYHLPRALMKIMLLLAA